MKVNFSPLFQGKILSRQIAEFEQNMTIHSGVLLVGGGIFLCCLCLHIFLWRIRHPRNHAAALLAVFIIPGAALIVLLSFVWHNFSAPDLLAIALLHIALSCTYIQIYPASQADSPSLKILVIVGRAMPGGMTEAEIREHFDADELFLARVRDLLDARLVLQSEGRLMLTPKGRSMVRPFILLRTLIGLSSGGG